MATPNIVPRSDSEGGLGTASKYWASAYIDDVFVSKIGRDTDNYLDFSTDNEIQLRVNGNHEIIFNANQIHPVSDDGIALGYAGRGFSDLFLASGAVINFDSGDIALTHSSNALEFTGGLMRFTDSQKLTFGDGNDLEIYHDGTDSYIHNDTGNLKIENDQDDGTIDLRADNSAGGLTTYLKIDGANHVVQSFQNFKLGDNTKHVIGDNGDLQISHSGSHANITNATGNLDIINNANDGDIIFKSDDGSGGIETYFFLDGSLSGGNPFTVFPDDSILTFGNSQDLQIKHDGTSFISNTAGTDLVIRQFVDDRDIIFQSDDGAGSVATYFFLDGSSATHDGSATTSLFTNWPDKSRISLGTSHDLRLFHDSANTYIDNNTGDLFIMNNADNKDIIFQCDDGSGGVETYFFLDGSATSGSPVTVFPDNSILYFGDGLDFSIGHNGSNSVITNTGGNVFIDQQTDDGSVYFRCDDGSGGITNYLQLDGANVRTTFVKPGRFLDNVELQIGLSADLKIYHDATDTIFLNQTGDFYIANAADDKDIIFQSDDGSGGLTTYFLLDGSRADGTFKYIEFPDNSIIGLGNDTDAQMYHNGTNSIIDNYTGDFLIQQKADDKDIILSSDDGSGGVTAYVTVDGSTTTTFFSKNTRHEDAVLLQVGSGNDASFFHNGTDTFLTNDTGDLRFRQFADDKDIMFECDDGSGGTTPYFRLDGANAQTEFEKNAKFLDSVELRFGNSNDIKIYHNGSTSNSNIENNTGDLYVTQYVNDGDIIFRSDDGSGDVTPYLTLDGGDVSTIVNTIKVMMPNLPTSNPNNAGQLYNDGGTLKISAG